MTVNRKRLLAAVLTAVIVFTILLSACAVVIEAAHDCSGEDCDICRILGSIVGVMRSLAYTAAVLSAVLLADIGRCISRLSAWLSRRLATPVTEKVRLLN